jgi:RNA polymerase sigma factor (sigma-70 family)
VNIAAIGKTMQDDRELLREYVESKSETAFREFVERHLPFVYSIALRRVGGDVHLAQDVTQQVFTDLARKSAVLFRHHAINGWLFVSARYAAAEAVRRERRRHEKEQEAMIFHQVQLEGASASEWEHLRSGLDDLVDRLAEKDREAVLLRFFQGLTFADIGTRLGLNENAARMRVERALEKIRRCLARQGVKSSAGVLALVLAGQAGAAMPAGLADVVTGSAVASSAAGGATLLWQLFTMNKITASLIGVVAAAFIATSAGITKTSGATSIAVAVTTPTQTVIVQSIESPPTVLAAETLAPMAIKVDQPRPPAIVPEPRIEVINTSQLDRQPIPLIQDPPEYAFEAKRAGIKGEVLVDFTVDENGDVRNATAIESSTRMFEQSALLAVGKWKFRPGIKAGRPVSAHIRVSIEFR